MNIEEIRMNLDTKTKEVRGLMNENKIDEAEKLMEEVRGLQKQIKIVEELNANEMRDLQNQKETKEERGKEMGKVNELRAVTKAVLGKEVSAEERAVIKSADNNVLYPSQFIAEIDEIKKGFGSLKGYCQVIPVTKNSGTKPIVDFDQNTLAKISEGANIVEGSLVSSDINFTCEKYGLIDTLSSEAVEDAEVEIEGIVRGNFAEIAVAQENGKIMNIIDNNATPLAGSDYTALEDAMASAVPAVKAGLVTLCNQEGYALLKNMKDKQGRNLGLVTEQGGVEYFNGKPLITFDSSLVEPSPDKTCVFYSLSMKEAIKFFDRKGIQIAKSTEAGFANDTVKIRVLERFDVQAGSTRSIKKLEL